MSEEGTQPKEEVTALVETFQQINTVISKQLRSALKPLPSDHGVWPELLRAYGRLEEARLLVTRVLAVFLPTDDGQKVAELLVKIRQAERDNLELRVAQARKVSAVDVTTEFQVSDVELLNDTDTTLRRIALANAKKYGRALLQKWHPDRPGGDADVFQLCQSAIKSGDVELVHILLYRYGDSNQESPPEFHPEALLRKVKVRTEKLYGSRLHRVFSLYACGNYEAFRLELITLLEKKLQELRLMNVPFGTIEPEEENESE